MGLFRCARKDKVEGCDYQAQFIQERMARGPCTTRNDKRFFVFCLVFGQPLVSTPSA